METDLARKAAKVSADMPENIDSRSRLLDAAEILFADKGYNGISTRDIAALAKVNLGSIPYYFGTKENLLKEVLMRRVLPRIKEQRENLLALMKKSEKPKLEDVVYATLEPAFRESRAHTAFGKLAGKLATDSTPEVRKIMNELYDPRKLVFPKALRAACPELGSEEFNWRIMCFYGVMFYVLADTGRMQTVAGSDFDTSQPETALKYVLPFVVAGFKAPPGKKQAEKKKK